MLHVRQSESRRYCHSNSSEAALCRVLHVLASMQSAFTSRKEQISNKTVICISVITRIECFSHNTQHKCRLH